MKHLSTKYLSTRPFIHTASLSCLITLLLPMTALADDWNLRVLGQRVTTSEDVLADLDDGPGIYLGLERRLSDRWGVEMGLGWNRLEGSVSDSFDLGGVHYQSHSESEVDWLPLSLAANFHLTPDSGFDLYVSGRAGWAFFEDVSASSSQIIEFGPPVGTYSSQGDFEIATEDKFFYGIRLGFDRPFGTSGWAVSATIDWTDLELEIDPRSFRSPPIDENPLPGSLSPVSIDLDPVTVGVGFSKRF